MTNAQSRPPVSPGEHAPDFTLPAVDGKAPVSLADYRGRSPVFLALLIGLWCPFCRRQIAQIGANEAKLKPLGVESLAIVATPPENAQLYFKFRPSPVRLASDPHLTTHRAYGIPKPELTPEFMKAMETTRINPFQELPGSLPVMEAAMATAKRDGYVETATDRPRRHRALGQHRVRDRGYCWSREVPRGGGDSRRGSRNGGPLADGAADLRVERAERVDHRVDRARARLKDRGRVERDPLEAHRFELDHAGHDPVVLGVEPLALGVLRRRRHHALQADRAGIAPGGLGEAADRRDVAPRAGGIGHLAAEPAVAH